MEIYLDKSDNNTFSFEIDLWQEQSDENLKNLAVFFHQNKISETNVLLDDTYVITKTFVYDSVVTNLDPGEVITLAKDSIDFEITPESVTFNLEADNDRTLVRTRIFNQNKFQILTNNLQKLSLKVLDFETVSSAVINLYSHFDKGQYFFFYPLTPHDHVAILSNNSHVYLTSIIKNTLPDLKKLLNYAQAYFSNKDPKQYLPGENYNEVEICQRFRKASNLPLPVLSFFVGNTTPATAIIKPITPVTDSTQNLPPMENNNKKSILPIIAVFIITAAVASIIVWFILTRNNNDTEINNPSGGDTPMAEETTIPEITQAPTPTIAELSKSLKIQVLNSTDINGQAATIKAELVKLGFTSVNTGNGTEAATSNQIQVKKDIVPDYFLQNIPEFASSTVTELSSTSTYDVVFIIGVDLKASTPSASPTVSN